MKKLFIYLREYKKECVFAPLFKMLEASFELFVPLVVAAIIDTGIAHADKGYVIRMCLLLFLLALIGRKEKTYGRNDFNCERSEVPL